MSNIQGMQFLFLHPFFLDKKRVEKIKAANSISVPGTMSSGATPETRFAQTTGVASLHPLTGRAKLTWMPVEPATLYLFLLFSRHCNSFGRTFSLGAPPGGISGGGVASPVVSPHTTLHNRDLFIREIIERLN